MNSTVFLVEDDATARAALTRLLEANGLQVRAFASAEDLLLSLDAERRSSGPVGSAARARFDRLTPREQEVMSLVATGTSNKETARRLRISYRTVETHRARVMRKMGATNLLELVRMSEVVRPRA